MLPPGRSTLPPVDLTQHASLPQQSTIPPPVILQNQSRFAFRNTLGAINLFHPASIQTSFVPMMMPPSRNPMQNVRNMIPPFPGCPSNLAPRAGIMRHPPPSSSLPPQQAVYLCERNRSIAPPHGIRRDIFRNGFQPHERYNESRTEYGNAGLLGNHSEKSGGQKMSLKEFLRPEPFVKKAVEKTSKVTRAAQKNQMEKQSDRAPSEPKTSRKRQKSREDEEGSSSADSDFEQSSTGKAESPRWHKLTAEDIIDQVLSDSDDEVIKEQSTVAESGCRSYSVFDEQCYVKVNGNQCATSDLRELQNEFKRKLLNVIATQRQNQPKSDPCDMPAFHSSCKCGHGSDTDTDASSSDEMEESSSDSDNEIKNNENSAKKSKENAGSESSLSDNNDGLDDYAKMSEAKRHNTLSKREIARKRNHPAILHPDVCFNEAGQMNDGPECRCSWSAKRRGVRHNKYAGEAPIPSCDPSSSNLHRLHHYVLHVDPNPNTTARRSTKILHDEKEYELDGFSVFFHKPLPQNFPQSPLSKWSNEYSVCFYKENPPENYTIDDLELFHQYLFNCVMEMYDLKRFAFDVSEGCPYYHCMPRFVRSVADFTKEILPMSVVMRYLIDQYRPVVSGDEAVALKSDSEAFRKFSDKHRGSLLMNADKKPSTIRADLFDKADYLKENPNPNFPLITHFGVRPSSHTYNSDPKYQKLSKEYQRMKRMLSLKPRVSPEERERLARKASELKAMRNDSQLRRDFVMSVSSKDFYQTGLYPDIVQHAMLMILACAHVRFQWSLEVYEKERIGYTFKDRSLLELALTHPSYRTNYGTNTDHARNTLNNCGIPSRQRANERAQQQQLSNKKRGFNTLIEIMSKQGSKKAEQSPLNHNERLEFLGDAVIEFISTIHLFFMFDELDEGGLATFRSTMVQNKNLAVLAKKIGLDEFMLYAHGPDLCHESDLRHAMANAFEAMMAAIYLDAGIDECDRIFGTAMFGDREDLMEAWFQLQEHPLKRDNPYGDRHLIKDVPALQLLTELEKSIGVTFKHIRVLAKAFTRRNVGFNNLTLGHNQRLEFLGDTILQMITTDYLYKHFPYHHEGHLSILRTCLVSNKTQSVICDDIGMTKYLVTPKAMQKSGPLVLRVKDKADLVEAFLGALYVDRGFDYCKVFCRVCFFPRLKIFIVTQRWNDPKSQLQQCCLTLRQMDGSEPDIPEYKTIAVEGPTNTRVYKVAVYFKKKRLAVGMGHTLQYAQMHAARNALCKHADLFPNLKQKKPKKTTASDGRGKKRQRSAGKDEQAVNSETSQGETQLVSSTQIQSLLDLKFDSSGHLI